MITNRLTWLGKAAFLEVLSHRYSLEKVTQADLNKILNRIVDRLTELEPPPVTSLEILLAEDCNLACDYCFEYAKGRRRMTEETARKAVDFLMQESKDEEHVSILFFGGEPLLNFRVLELLTKYAEERAEQVGKKVRFAMTTNATLFTERSIKFCKDHNIDPLISVDGDAETHDRHRKTCSGKGSFTRIAKIIPALKEAYGPLQARLTVHLDTVDRVYDNVHYLISIGFNRFIVASADGIKWLPELYKTFRKQLEQLVVESIQSQHTDQPFDLYDVTLAKMQQPLTAFGCRAARGSLCVRANGDLIPCSMIFGIDSLAEVYHFGNVCEGITNPIARQELLIINQHRIGSCLSCRQRRGCSGGCFVKNWEFTGSMVTSSLNACMVQTKDIYIKRLYRKHLMIRDTERQKRGPHPADEVSD